MQPTSEITDLLRAWNEGASDALDRLLPMIYQTLHKIAVNHMRRERTNHTLQPTELVSEAFLRLSRGVDVEWKNRAHFYGVASRAMRQILVEHARSHNRDKRGAGVTHVTLSQALNRPNENETLELTHLDDALKSLERFAPRQCRIVEMKFFGGLNVEEISAVLEISPATVKREWSVARKWLYRELNGKERP